jgi:hypothetical protein
VTRIRSLRLTRLSLGRRLEAKQVSCFKFGPSAAPDRDSPEADPSESGPARAKQTHPGPAAIRLARTPAPSRAIRLARTPAPSQEVCPSESSSRTRQVPPSVSLSESDGQADSDSEPTRALAGPGRPGRARAGSLVTAALVKPAGGLLD